MKKTFVFWLAFAIAIFGNAQNKRITILSLNDMHSTIEYFPKFAAIADSLRAIDPNLIVLGAGDNRTGNPYNDRAEIPGYPMIAMMNAVGFNASAIGNHEWDNKWDGFRTLVNLADFPFLCCNIEIPDTMRLHVYPYRFMNVNGVKVGILGTIQTGVQGIPDCHPDNIVGIKFIDHDDALADYKWMRDQCDVIILLSHDGYTADVETANKYPWLDQIIGGHSHTLVDANTIKNGVLITQAKNKLSYADITKIYIADGKVVSKTTELINVRGFSKENANVAKMVTDFSHNPSMGMKVVTIEKDLHNSEELGCMMCDAILQETGSDISLQNGGGVRFDSFKCGVMTVADILKLDPFGNEAVVYELTGQEVADYIQNCFIVDESQIPYVGGITYEMTIGKDNRPTGIKIKMLNGKKFDLKKKYKFVTNSYVAAVIQSKHVDKGIGTYKACSDYMIKYLRNKGSVDYQNVYRASIKKLNK